MGMARNPVSRLLQKHHLMVYLSILDHRHRLGGKRRVRTGCRAEHCACDTQQPGTIDRGRHRCAGTHTLWFQHGRWTSRCRAVIHVGTLHRLPPQTETRGSHHVHQSRRRTRGVGPTEARTQQAKRGCLFSFELPTLPCSACIYLSRPSSRPEGLSYDVIHFEGPTCYACMPTPSSRGRHEPP